MQSRHDGPRHTRVLALHINPWTAGGAKDAEDPHIRRVGCELIVDCLLLDALPRWCVQGNSYCNERKVETNFHCRWDHRTLLEQTRPLLGYCEYARLGFCPFTRGSSSFPRSFSLPNFCHSSRLFGVASHQLTRLRVCDRIATQN